MCVCVFIYESGCEKSASVGRALQREEDKEMEIVCV